MPGQTTRIRWKRTSITGACFALALGALACSGENGHGVTGTIGGAAGASSDPTGAVSSGGAMMAGGSAGATSVTLDAGRTVIRRLNRSEYNFTVRDLLGTSS